ncbi:MAG TPA: EscU/YscU/HrcU family type III secretion system export apparatus switch protein [Spirochaetota bacterium]|nr:EscU/YscU/HrcU family type III secretion system export apparatus switch protein [Spirochaetota bacterium]HPJ39448.1 EscU/YscU/HrcU family type III secretion system export apparatus switch protein [Spirochaetota bacterium]HPQ54480.1 EscU/YscU/HrcU family type III secretion system export apparatus switch protein [Spirochaetota bacterium]
MDRKKAVALGYDGGDASPSVLAVARGILAEKLLELAREHGITIVNDPDLAGVLSELNAGDEIPEHLFRAVAEVFGYCYRMNSEFRKKFDGFGY